MTVANCVRDSGLLQLIDAAYGLSDTSGGSDGGAAAADGD